MAGAPTARQHRRAGCVTPHPRRVNLDPRKDTGMRLRALDRAPDAPPATAQAVRLDGIRKVYGHGDGAVVALDGVSAGFDRGSFTAVMGPSGSGKSTFLHMAAGLDRPTAGMVRLGDTALAGLSERRLTILRRQRVGFIFQAFNLMPALTVTQNIGLPLRLNGRRP